MCRRFITRFTLLIVFLSVTSFGTCFVASQHVEDIFEVAYIDDSILNYNIIRNVAALINISTTLISPSEVCEYNFERFKMVAIGPFAHELRSYSMPRECLERIVEVERPILLIGNGPALIFDEINEELAGKFAHGFVEPYVLIREELLWKTSLFSYPFNITTYVIRESGIIKLYDTPIAMSAHLSLSYTKGLFIGLSYNGPTYYYEYAAIAIYKGNKTIYAIWGYDQLSGITEIGKKLLANIIYWLLYKSDEYEAYDGKLFTQLDYRPKVPKDYYVLKDGIEWGIDTNSTVWDVALTTNGEYIIIGEVMGEEDVGSVRIFDKNGSEIYRKRIDRVVWEVDVDDRGNTFIACGDMGTLLLIYRKGDELHEVVINLNDVVGIEKAKVVVTGGLSLGANGTALLVGTTDGHLLIYRIDPFREVQMLIMKLKIGDQQLLTSVARYADKAVVAIYGGGEIFLLSVNGKILHDSHVNGRISSLFISPDGKYIVVGTFEGKVLLFDEQMRKMWDYDVSKDFTSDINCEIWAVRASLNGDVIAATGLHGYVLFFNRSGDLTAAFRTNVASRRDGGILGNWVLDMSVDGNYAVSGAAEPYGNGYIFMRNLEKWTLLEKIFTYEAVRTVAISPDGKFVAVGTVDSRATYPNSIYPDVIFHKLRKMLRIIPVKLNISIEPTEVKVGEEVRIIGSIEPPLEGVCMVLRLQEKPPSAFWNEKIKVVTGRNGKFNFTWIPSYSNLGEWFLSASLDDVLKYCDADLQVVYVNYMPEIKIIIEKPEPKPIQSHALAPTRQRMHLPTMSAIILAMSVIITIMAILILSYYLKSPKEN